MTPSIQAQASNKKPAKKNKQATQSQKEGIHGLCWERTASPASLLSGAKCRTFVPIIAVVPFLYTDISCWYYAPPPLGFFITLSGYMAPNLVDSYLEAVNYEI